jgi:glycosyltransferase involved in cell wall biosynthesis
MILAIEPTWTGTVHASSNAAALEVVRLAFPQQTVRVFAEITHLQELQASLGDAASSAFQFESVQLSDAFRHKPHIVSLRRLFNEVQIIRRALSSIAPSEDCLLILLSATSTSLFAAELFSRGRSGRTFIQAVLHGNLNELTGWRHRDPIRRRLDLKSVLCRNYNGRMRYLVLEEFVRSRLAVISPATAEATDVLPHPLAMHEEMQSATPLAEPLRIGLVGLGSEEKGMGSFLRIAMQLRNILGDKIRFHHVGSIVPGADASLFGLLEETPSTKHLTRSEFLARINHLHYFVFPFKKNYYGLSASGAFLDAIAALKPVIATRVPLTEQFFREFGTLGHLCEDEAEMVSTITDIALQLDTAAYDAQVNILRTARSMRLPETLALRYRDLVMKNLPGFAA